MTTLTSQAMIAAPPTEALMVRKAQVFIHAAIDRYLGELARQGKSPETTRKYRYVLDKFGDSVNHMLPEEITRHDVERYIDLYALKSPATLALYVTVMRKFFEFCQDDGLIETSPAAKLKRPRRPAPEDLDVVSVTFADVKALLAACVDTQERLCVGTLAYMGVRATAAANIRRRDANLETGHMRFHEKNRKAITKPIPADFLAWLRELDEAGQWLHGDEWLIPFRRPSVAKHGPRRSRKIVYETIVRVGKRARVRVHPHAIRAAFAVNFDAQHPGHLRALKELLGHARLDTTQRHYLRRASRSAAMETVRDLNWGIQFPPGAAMPRTGFEPVLPPSALVEPTRTENDSDSVADTLLEEARSRAESGEAPAPVDEETVA